MCFIFFSLFHVLIQLFYLMNYFFGFLCKAHKCLETCVNCLWKWVTPLFTPFDVKFSTKKIFKNVFLPHLKYKTCSNGYIWKILRRQIILGKMDWQSLLQGGFDNVFFGGLLPLGITEFQSCMGSIICTEVYFPDGNHRCVS